jgi:hypothetical protein
LDLTLSEIKQVTRITKQLSKKGVLYPGKRD